MIGPSDLSRLELHVRAGIPYQVLFSDEPRPDPMPMCAVWLDPHWSWGVPIIGRALRRLARWRVTRGVEELGRAGTSL